MALEQLFDAELEYQPAMAPLAGEGEGIPVGSGDGSVVGPALCNPSEPRKSAYDDWPPDH
jgi:hypothetical protein